MLEDVIIIFELVDRRVKRDPRVNGDQRFETLVINRHDAAISFGRANNFLRNSGWI